MSGISLRRFANISLVLPWQQLVWYINMYAPCLSVCVSGHCFDPASVIRLNKLLQSS